MKVFELLNKTNIKEVVLRVGEYYKNDYSKSYNNSELKFWGDYLDLPPKYSGYIVNYIAIKNGILFIWAKEEKITVKDITCILNNNYYVIKDYISKYDAEIKNYEHSITIDETNNHLYTNICDCEVLDIDTYDDVTFIYIFSSKLRSNVFDNTTEDLKFYPS